nr:MAG TPA: hypothetical protein [Caudoviricetes sp.]
MYRFRLVTLYKFLHRHHIPKNDFLYGQYSSIYFLSYC